MVMPHNRLRLDAGSPVRLSVILLFLFVASATSCKDDTAQNTTEPDGFEAALPTDPDGTISDTEAVPGYDPTADIDPEELPIDRDPVIGELGNGLTYYLRSHDSPAGELALFLVVKAGSINEPDGAEGASHYLAHMLFNGTERYPGHEIRDVIQDLGLGGLPNDLGLGGLTGDLGIGGFPDEYATSSWDATVYNLRLTDSVSSDSGGGSDGTGSGPKPRPDSVSSDSGGGSDSVRLVFDILAQMASAASLDPEYVNSERDIIRDEYKMETESLENQLGRFLDYLYVDGTPYQDRHPIGDLRAIRSMSSTALREFYDTWYRPAKMAVVVVGDLPTSLLEELVHEYFGGMEDRSSDVTDVRPADDFTTELKPDPVVESLTIGGVGPARVSFDWRAPAWPEGTVGGERRLLMERLILGMLENRLIEEFFSNRLALDNPPLLLDFSLGNALRIHGTNFGGDDLTAGITDLLSVLEGAAEGSVLNNES